MPGALVTVLGVALLLFGLFGHASSAASLVGLGAALTFVGVAILSPLIARRLAGVIGLPIRRLGIQGRLGRENAMRNPRRTASTASALMIGLGLVAMVSILSASLTASITDTLQRTLKADYVLTSSSFAPFSPERRRQGATGARCADRVGVPPRRVPGERRRMPRSSPSTRPPSAR